MSMILKKVEMRINVQEERLEKIVKKMKEFTETKNETKKED